MIGGVRIGSRTRVGANAVVVHDVPDGATVVGIPARVVRLRDVDALDTAEDCAGEQRELAEVGR